VGTGEESFRADGGVRPGHQHALGARGRGRRIRFAGVSWTFARRARSTCATARIRIRKPRSIPIARAESRAPSSCKGKELSYNNLVDLDAAWQLIREFDGRRRRSSSTPIRAGARREARWRELSAGVRSRSHLAFGGVLAFNRAWIAKRPRRSRRRSWKRLPRRVMTPPRVNCWRRRRTCGCWRWHARRKSGGEIDQRRLSGADRRTRTAGARRMPGEDGAAARRKKNGARSSSRGRCANT
jgi:hypothetical protein